MKKRKLALLLTICIAVSFPGMFMSGCGKNPPTAALVSVSEKDLDIATKLDKYMTAYNENCSYKYSGTILVAKGNEILLKKGYGMANYEEKIPNEPDNVFAIGSISKSFTAAAIMQLQEKGLLNVNDPISKYIHGIKRGDDITIHQLLTHTSGLSRDGLMVGSFEVSLEEDINFINEKPMLFEPGKGYSYSNAGYIILAAIIEKVSGKLYNDYIRDNIFIPLKMDSSRGGKDASYGDNQSIGYNILTDAPMKLPMFNFSEIKGCGNIYSTVEDLYKYDRALYDEKLLSKESLDTMFTSYPVSNCGYGWGITERFGHKEISHNGHIDGYFSSIIRFPDDDIVLIFLSNNNDNTAINEISGIMSPIVLGQDYVMSGKLNVVEVNSEILKKYAGKYELGESLFTVISYSNGKLCSEFGDGISYELLPISETDFYPKNYENSRVKFIMDKNNNAVSLETISNGIVYKGKKVN